MSFNDIELLVLLAMMGLMFLLDLKRRESVVEGKYTGIDLPMSSAIKGIACVLILMGHFAARKIAIDDASRLTLMVYRTTANIALALFMYFSGYGLSLKKHNGGGSFYLVQTAQKSVYPIAVHLRYSYGALRFVASKVFIGGIRDVKRAQGYMVFA